VSGDKIREFDVALFAASCDDVETNTKFAESLDLDYPILSDPDREVVTDWGMIKSGGKNAPRWTVYVGKDGKVLEIDKSVSPRSYGDVIATKLLDLGVDKK